MNRSPTRLTLTCLALTALGAGLTACSTHAANAPHNSSVSPDAPANQTATATSTTPPGTTTPLIAPAGSSTSAGSPTSPTGVPVPAGFQPQSVTFVSASQGWVLGTAPCTRKPCTWVVRTLNGGRTWQDIPAPKAQLRILGQVNGVDGLRFADPFNGFAYGSELYATHNGGSTWHRVRLPGTIGDLAAGNGVVYATVRGPAGRESIYRSPAGSDRWSRVAGLPAAVAIRNPSAIAVHGSAAWIFLGTRLYATKTGTGWIREPLPCGVFGVDSLAAYDKQQVTLLCAGDSGMGQSGKVVYSSRDGGAHFTRIGQAPMGGIGGALAQPQPRRVFIATSSAASWIYAGIDGGRTWHTALTLPDGGAGLRDFGFTTPTQGVAVNGYPLIGSHLYMTRNGGRSWFRVRF